MTEEGVGALAYSGKLMIPSPLPPTVHSVMREVEISLAHFDKVRPYVVVDGEGVVGGGGGGGGGGEDKEGGGGGYFDCALCNHYPNSRFACRFHSDPDHGRVWERLTCVVSEGDCDHRQFSFCPVLISHSSSSSLMSSSSSGWEEWDKGPGTRARRRRDAGGGEALPRGRSCHVG